jgi:hypothetical protein
MSPLPIISKRKYVMLAMIAFFGLSTAHSQTVQQTGRKVFTLERPASGNVSCDNYNNCSYRVQNVAPRIQVLLRDALHMAFGDSFITFEEGNIRPFVKGYDTIVFRFNTEDRKQRFVSALSSLDQLEDLSLAAPQVKFTFKVYALDTLAYNNLELGLTAFANSGQSKSAPANRVTLGSESNAAGILKTGLQLNLGNLTSALFGLKLDLSRLSSWSMSSIDYETIVTNGESIAAYTNTPTYNKAVSSSVSVERADIGLNITGRVFLDRNGERLRVEKFFVRYAAPTPDENSIMNETMVERPSLRIEIGKPYVLGTKTVLLDANSKGNNFIFAGKSSKNTISSTLIMVITAQLDEGSSANKGEVASEIGDRSDGGSATGQNSSASDEYGRGISIMDSLKQAKGYVLPINQPIGSVLFGQMAGIRIDPKQIDGKETDQVIAIKETNLTSGRTTKSYAKLGALASQGYFFKTLNFNELQIPCQKQEDKCQSMHLEINLSEMNSSESITFMATYLPEQRVNLLSVAPTEKPKKSRFFSSSENGN